VKPGTTSNEPGAAGDPADDAGGAVPVQPPAVTGEEQRSIGALAGGQVDGAGGARGEGDGDDLAALAGDDQGAVAALGAHVLDVRASRHMRGGRVIEQLFLDGALVEPGDGA